MVSAIGIVIVGLAGICLRYGAWPVLTRRAIGFKFACHNASN